MQVIKRTGAVVAFKIDKIFNAVDKAFLDVRKENISDELKSVIKRRFEDEEDSRSSYGENSIEIEQIQDIVEDVLMGQGYLDIAKSYIIYRESHRDLRFIKERADYIENYMHSSKNAASSSETDANANVAVKNVANLNAEVYKSTNRRIQRYNMAKMLKKTAPQFEKSYLEDLKHHIIYAHDEASFPMVTNYCQAVSLWPFMMNGTSGMDGLGTKPPHNLNSFAGQFSNLVFLHAAQCKGACMYKEQEVIIRQKGIVYKKTIKELVEEYFRTGEIHHFENYQGKWEYVNTDELEIAENHKFVKVSKLYKRTYDGIIYRIKSHTGCEALCTKDHLFKQMLAGRRFEQKAENLIVGDTVDITKDLSFLVNTNSLEWKKGWMTGLLCADGCLTQDNLVSLAVNYEQKFLGNIFNEYLNECYGETLNKNKGHKCFNYQSHSKRIHELLTKDIIGNNTYTKHIDIDAHNLDYLLGFLDGIFCGDGSYTKARGISITLSNELLSKNIFDIVNILGIHYKGYHILRGKNGRKDSYSQYIPVYILKYLHHTLKKILQKKSQNIINEGLHAQELYYFGHSAFRNTSKGLGLGYYNRWSRTKAEIKYNTDIITEISSFQNDDDYVYEVETSSHWYNCGGFLTHNCAYGEFFNVLDYYCAKDFGLDYVEHLKEFVYLGPKFRKLLRETKTWFDTIEELRTYDFANDELNAIRDEIVYDATRPATKEELSAWLDSVKKKDFSEIKMGDGTRTIEAQINQTFQQIIYSINQPAGNRSYQSPFTNFSYYDSGYWHALFGEMSYPDGSPLCWERVSFLQKHFMKWFNKERTKTLLTFPVETMALLSDGKDIIDKEYKAFTAEMYAEGHSFFTFISDSPNALASCCRLRNEITENVFSFTNGLTGVQTGSANVITLNHNRIIQDWARSKDYSRDFLKKHFFEKSEEYKEYLVSILERVYAYHIAYKTMLYETEDAGLLTSSNEGYISMRKLFSTIGDNGVNEAAEFVGLKCNYNPEYKRFCNILTGTIYEQNKLHSTAKFQFNQEFVPAEGLSSKNYRWDKEDGYWVPEGRVLYNSYFYLADDPNTSVLDKFRLHGREFTDLLDGGVGMHCNLEGHLSQDQYSALIDHAIACGTSYFTFNIPNSECTNPECHHIEKIPMDVCPVCGARMCKWTRIIGYMRPIEGFDEYRFIEAKNRHYARTIEK